MNSRERFLTALSFGAPDRVPLPCLFQDYEAETLRRWQREGMPRDVHPAAFFGFERCDLAPVYLGPIPAGDLADVEAAQEWRGTDRQHEDESVGRSDSAKESYPLRSREDWAAIRLRLNPDSSARYPRFFDDYVRTHREREYPLGIAFAGPFSTLRDWMGTRGLAEAIESDPAFVERMVVEMAEFAVAASSRGLRELGVDFAIVRERAAYALTLVDDSGEAGRLFAPWYREVSRALASHGVSARLVEARGNVTALIPDWLEGGLNGLLYAEASAGLDARRLRREYGRSLAIVGNVDSQALLGTTRDIRGEVEPKLELAAQGGYIPTPDHPVSAEVSFDNYQTYLNALRAR